MPYLVGAGLLCGAVAIVGLLLMVLDDRRVSRQERIAAAECRHPSGRQRYTSSCPNCAWHGPTRYDSEEAIRDLELHQIKAMTSA
jgi:hypothetical protein